MFFSETCRSYAPLLSKTFPGAYTGHLTGLVPADEVRPDTLRTFAASNSVGYKGNQGRLLGPLLRPDTSVCSDMTFSPEQQQVIDAVMQGKNVFFTGPAGECL